MGLAGSAACGHSLLQGHTRGRLPEDWSCEEVLPHLDLQNRAVRTCEGQVCPAVKVRGAQL